MEPFESIGEHLVNDRAVAMNVPYVDKAAELSPFTSCTALSAGWVWDIPLWSRRGVGYVYSSRHLGDEEAEMELREHLGWARVESIPHRKITIRHGRHRRPWVKNCVAIGLAAGFIEPLESTGISLTQLDVVDLGGLLADEARYNERVTARFDATVDFIQAHYVLTSRDDTPDRRIKSRRRRGGGGSKRWCWTRAGRRTTRWRRTGRVLPALELELHLIGMGDRPRTPGKAGAPDF